MPVEKEQEEDLEEIAPQFLTQHSVLPSSWSYLPLAQGRAHSMVFMNPPPYHSMPNPSEPCDRNMNTSMPNNNHKIPNCVDEFGFDIHSVMTMEILEGTKGKPINGLVETRNEEVLRRVAEMQKMVESSEKYLNEQGELMHDFEVKSSPRLPWKDSSVDFDSDCDSMTSSKQSSNEETPAPGVLKHSDSLVLLAESINLDLSGITKGLNLIGTNAVNGDAAKSTGNTPVCQRKAQGLSQLLSDLHALSNDLSQSESDSESVYTPNSSPIHRLQTERSKNKSIRTSFGLHSPDSSTLGPESKDTNLREYLKLLKVASSKDCADIDLAARKLSELYGFEISDDTFIESDPDVIDLTAIPPPQTPDELDAVSVLGVAPNAPRGFDDPARLVQHDGDLERFLAQVAVAPPTQKVTPAKELTPEEIMSYIIPPPPGLGDDEVDKPSTNASVSKFPSYTESLYMNSRRESGASRATEESKVIEYATVDRKGAFSCCSKAKKEEPKASSSPSASPAPVPEEKPLQLPPRRVDAKEKPKPPERPPKNSDLQAKISTPANGSPTMNTFRLNGGSNGAYYDTTPPRFFPTSNRFKPANVATLPPRRPNLPPVPVKPVFRNPIPLPKLIGSDNRIAAITSPRFHRHLNLFSEAERNGSNGHPIPAQRSMNGHLRSNSESFDSGTDSRPMLSVLCSPQMTRKLSNDSGRSSPSGSPLLESRNGHVINVDSLMAKTDVAMAGLLMKLDQIAAQCSAAQSAGGGEDIDETKFQRARNELTDTALKLVTSSKALVVSMSSATPTSLPENLSASLQALRRITELAQDMTKHTSSPLQTRNIVLKVHDVASSFRELAGVQTGPAGAAPLALQAECLANVLAALLRSLRIFSP